MFQYTTAIGIDLPNHETIGDISPSDSVVVFQTPENNPDLAQRLTEPACHK
jgi:hypothetical protein